MDMTFRISDFIGLEKPAVYADSHYFTLSPLEKYAKLCKGMSVNGLLLIFCTDGSLAMTINGKFCTIEAGTCLMCPPNTTLSDIRQQSHGSSTVVGYSMEILSRMLTGGERVCQVFNALTQKSVITNDQRFLMARIDVFLSTLRYRNSSNDLYHDELVYHLFATLLFDVINDLHIPAGSKKTTDQTGSHYRMEQIYKKFLTLLSREDGHNRAVSYFADKLFITPKYLTRITNLYAGRPALEVIIDHAVERLKIEIKYTDHPMKDIADDFGFESYSTFCKFIKKYTGMTPQQCRNQNK